MPSYDCDQSPKNSKSDLTTAVLPFEYLLQKAGIAYQNALDNRNCDYEKFIKDDAYYVYRFLCTCTSWYIGKTEEPYNRIGNHISKSETAKLQLMAIQDNKLIIEQTTSCSPNFGGEYQMPSGV